MLSLTRLRFVVGARNGEPALEIAPGTITLVVGPNNSGKSRALSEILSWAQGAPLPGLVVDDAAASFPAGLDEFLALLGSYCRVNSSTTAGTLSSLRAVCSGRPWWARRHERK